MAARFEKEQETIKNPHELLAAREKLKKDLLLINQNSEQTITWLNDPSTMSKHKTLFVARFMAEGREAGLSYALGRSGNIFLNPKEQTQTTYEYDVTQLTPRSKEELLYAKTVVGKDSDDLEAEAYLINLDIWRPLKNADVNLKRAEGIKKMSGKLEAINFALGENNIIADMVAAKKQN